MNKIALYLSISGFGNMIFLFSEDKYGGYESIYIINIVLRLFVSVWLLYTAYQIWKLKYAGWLSMAALIWFLAALLLISPISILIGVAPVHGFELVMLLIGQWSACALMIWAWFGWWRNVRSKFLRGSEK